METSVNISVYIGLKQKGYKTNHVFPFLVLLPEDFFLDDIHCELEVIMAVVNVIFNLL